jgi:hypothetical protein
MASPAMRFQPFRGVVRQRLGQMLDNGVNLASTMLRR